MLFSYWFIWPIMENPGDSASHPPVKFTQQPLCSVIQGTSYFVEIACQELETRVLYVYTENSSNARKHSETCRYVTFVRVRYLTQ